MHINASLQAITLSVDGYWAELKDRPHLCLGDFFFRQTIGLPTYNTYIRSKKLYHIVSCSGIVSTCNICQCCYSNYYTKYHLTIKRTLWVPQQYWWLACWLWLRSLLSVSIFIMVTFLLRISFPNSASRWTCFGSELSNDISLLSNLSYRQNIPNQNIT